MATKTNVTPVQRFPCPDELWAAMKELASDQGIPMAKAMREAMENHLRANGYKVPNYTIREMSRSAAAERTPKTPRDHA